MDQNHYQPPRSQLNPHSREPGSIPKAVAIGAFIDIGGTTVASLIIGFLYAAMLGIQGHSNAEIQQALMQPNPWSPLGLLFLGTGLLMSVLGGYQCAVIANRTDYLAPGIVSLISVAFGAFLNDGQPALPQLLFFSALTVAAILGGAGLQIRKIVERSSSRTAK